MRVTRLLAVGLTAALAVAGLSACGGGDGGVIDKAKNDKKLVIGVKADQPGLGLQTGTQYEGFDIEIA